MIILDQANEIYQIKNLFMHNKEGKSSWKMWRFFYGDTEIRRIPKGWELGDCRKVVHENAQNP